MKKNKVKLDRKSRRALQHLANKMVKSDYTSNEASYSSSLKLFGSGIVKGTLSAGSSSGGPKSRPLDLPAIEGKVYVSKYFLEFKTNTTHARIFKEFHPDVDWTMVARRATDTAISHDQYAFYSEDDLTTFEQWMGDYLAKFGEHIRMELPPPNGQTVMVKSKFYKGDAEYSMSDHSVKLEQWLWILRNCSGEVRHTGDFWFFELQEDADIFSMAFM